MGTSTNAMLVYGYDLGDADQGWKIQGVGEDETPQLSWLRTPSEDDEDDEREEGDEDYVPSFQTQALLHLARAAGHDVEYDFEAEEKIGLSFASHCSGQYPMWLFAAKVITACRGYPETLDFEELERERVAQDWDGKFTRALQVLEITPTQERPRWFMCSYWG